MRADLDTLLTNVNCMADDLLPCKPRRRRRLRVPAPTTGSSSSTRRRSSAVDGSRPHGARRSLPGAPTATAEAIRASSGQCPCTAPSGRRHALGVGARARQRGRAGDGRGPAHLDAPGRRGDHRRQGLRLRRLRGRSRRPRRDPVSSRRRDEPGRSPHLAPIRQRIESIFRTCKDILTLERHGARTITGLRARVASRMPALAACVYATGGSGGRRALWVAFIA